MALKLADLIRGKLDKQQLPHEDPEKVWAGYGKGQRCDGCDAVILPAQVEYTFTIDERSFRLHVGCFGLWEANGDDVAGPNETLSVASASSLGSTVGLVSTASPETLE